MSWLQDHPEVSSVRVAAADLNGQARGKRIAARYAGKVETNGIRMPLSEVKRRASLIKGQSREFR